MATPATSNLTAAGGRDSLNGIVKEDASKNRVPVHVFDPNAPPEQKGAAAGKSRDKLQPVAKDQNGASSKGIPVDNGGSNIIPTINVKDVDQVSEKPAEDLTPALPGSVSTRPTPDIPEWYQAGWRAVAGIDKPLQEGEEKDRGILDLFLAEQYYGSWYHNAALIFFAVFASHFLTRFHFGWGWLFLVLAACNTYYSTSMARVRRRARDDIQRELVKVRLASEHETADWINHFLDRFWLIYEPVLSATVISSVDQILSTNTPPFLESLRLTTFTLGTKAPRIDRVRTHPNTAEDIVLMDWGLSFTPNDTSEMTQKQAENKVNPKIVLAVGVGKGVATATMPILLEDITFQGLMRIRLKLTNNFPHIQIVDISFLDKPHIDFVLKPLGGDTFGLDINHIPGLSTFIHQMTDATLGPMMYDPNVFTLNLEQLLSGTPLDTAIGVLQVTVQSARSLKGSKIGGGSPDPYVGISINDRQVLDRTKYKHNTYNPTWLETKFVLVNSLSDALTLAVYDYNDHRKDTLLGSASFQLEKLKEDAKQEGIESPILKDGKDRGLLRYDLSFYPVLKPAANGPDISLEATSGIVRLTLHQAKELDHTKSLTGELNPFAKVFLSNDPAPRHTSPLVKHTNNPVWESSTEFLCADKLSSVITVKVIDDRDFLNDPLLGYMSVRLEDVLDAMKEPGRDWWPLSGCKSGKLRMSAQWKPLNVAGALQGANQYTPPIGVVRLFLDKAVDVKNVEAALGGKSDPYVLVQVNNVTRGRTEVVNNNLNPSWEQFVYIPVHSLKETLLLQVMDYQYLTKDRCLGSVALDVSDLAQRSDKEDYPYQSTGIKNATDPIELDASNMFKGTLHYVAEFLPALALKGVKFERQSLELQRGADNGDENGGDVDVPVDSTPVVPEGVTVKFPINMGNGETNESEDHTEASSIRTAHTSAENPEPVQPLTELSREELFHQQSGIIVFNVLSGELAKKARVEILIDEGYWPVAATVKARSTSARWDHVGEGFVKELDFSQVWIRLDESSNDEKDDIIAEWKVDTKMFLRDTLDGPHTFTLTHTDEKTTSTVELECRYVPVPVTLDPRESVNNQGLLRVDLLDGQDITGVDRGGKSDPFAVFSLNGHKIYKSQIKKKTLEPEWKENFTTPVSSRVAADFSIEIFDWNQFETAKSLGSAKISLADLEPFGGTERVLRLTSPKHGEKGQVRIRLLFQPEIIAKSRKQTSTFTSTFTSISGMPIGAGKGVVQGVTGVFKKEVDFLAKRGEGDTLPARNLPVGQAGSQAAEPTDSVAAVASSPQSALPDVPVDGGDVNASVEPGTLKVTVFEAKISVQGDIKPYVVLRVGNTEHKTKHSAKSHTPEWNESFTFRAASTTSKLFAWLYDHKTLAKDKLLGEADVDIWQHVRPDAPTSADVLIDLNDGQGQVQARLEFVPPSNPLGRGSSSSMLVNRTQTAMSSSKFSIRGRRPGVPDHDD